MKIIHLLFCSLILSISNVAITSPDTSPIKISCKRKASACSLIEVSTQKTLKSDLPKGSQILAITDQVFEVSYPASSPADESYFYDSESKKLSAEFQRVIHYAESPSEFVFYVNNYSLYYGTPVSSEKERKKVKLSSSLCTSKKVSDQKSCIEALDVKGDTVKVTYKSKKGSSILKLRW